LRHSKHKTFTDVVPVPSHKSLHHLAAAAADTSAYNIWGNKNFTVEIYDLVSGAIIPEANVLIYRVKDTKLYDGLC
jgi:hypothetical protein